MATNEKVKVRVREGFEHSEPNRDPEVEARFNVYEAGDVLEVYPHQLEAFSDRLVPVDGSYEEQPSQEVRALQAKVDRKDASIRKMKDQVSELRSVNAALEDEVAALEAEVKELRAEIEGEDATAAAVELAEAENVDLNDVEGTGEGGRILKGDVEDYVEARESEDEESEGDEG